MADSKVFSSVKAGMGDNGAGVVVMATFGFVCFDTTPFSDYLRSTEFEKAVNFAESGDSKEKRPPTYVFTWGNFQYIRCFITDLSYTLTLFLPDGTPVRAKLDLTLEEVDESTSQPGMGAPSAPNRSEDTRSRRKKG
jgi:hypothetical protein